MLAREGRFDVVINNAAIYPAKPFEEFSLEDYQRVQRVNVEAGVVCVRAALPGMRERGWGRIVNIASVTFYGGWANLYPYVASKAALVGLTRAWAREFGAYGITVNAIAPGAFPTDAEKIHPTPRATRASSSTIRRSSAGAGRRTSPRPSSSSAPTAPASSPARRSTSTAAG